MPNVSIICPNKSLAEWKALSDAIGEDRAFIAFFRNHDSIPTVEVARTLLGEAEPAKVTNTGATPLAKPTPPVPVAQSNLEILTKEGEVTVKIPKDAHVVRLTPADKTKKPIITTAKEMSSGINTYQGTPWAKIEAGSIGLTKRFVPLPRGVVEIKARVKPTTLSVTTGESNEKPNLSPYMEADAGALAERASEFIRQTAGSAPGNNRLLRNQPDATTGIGAAFDAIEKAFGRKILFMDFGSAARGINGFIIPDIPSVIFVNAQSQNAPLVVVGHELFEHLKISDPKLYAEMMSALEPMVKGLDKWHQMLSDAYGKQTNLPEPPLSHSEKELVANFIGDSFADPDFWQRVADKEPALFVKLGRIVLDWLNKLLARLKGFGSYQYFTDIQKAHDVIASGLAKFSEKPLPEAMAGEGQMSIVTSPSEPLPLEVGADGNIHLQNAGRDVTVTGTNKMTPVEIAAGKERVIALMQRLKLPGVVPSPDAPEARNIFQVQPNDAEPVGYYDAEGRILIKELTDSVQKQNLPGEERALAPLLVRVIDYNRDAFEKLFSPQVFEELNALSIEQASETAQKLALMQGMTPSKDLLEIVRNLNFNLQRIYSTQFGGDAYTTFAKRVLEEFGKSFTDEELASIAASQPKTETLIASILNDIRKIQGNTIADRLHNYFSPKSAPKLARLERTAKAVEAAQWLIEIGEKAGLKKAEKKGTPLTPIQKLVLMIEPKNIEGMTKAIEVAVRQKEIEAGQQYALDTAPNKQAREELEALFYKGTQEPTPDQIELGLQYAKYAYLRVVRDNILGYSPVTGKLASKIVPTVSQLAKQLVQTPNFRQPEMKRRFIENLVDEIGATDEQAKVIWNALESTYGQKIKEARTKAIAAAMKSMTPREQEVMPRKDGKLWKRIEQFFNAGGENVGDLLKDVARLRGYTVPSDTEIARMKSLVSQEQALRTPSTAAVDKIRANSELNEQEKNLQLTSQQHELEAKTEYQRSGLMRDMAVSWSKMAQPINFPGLTSESWKRWWINRGNLVDAMMEYITHDVLFKVGFEAFRLPIHISAQELYYAPTRAAARIALEFNQSPDKNLSKFWQISWQTLSDTVQSTIASFKPAATTFTAGIRGKRLLDKADADRMMHSVNAMERIWSKADEYAKKGDYLRATLTYIMGAPRQVGMFLNAIDGAQQVFVEYQELLNQASTALRQMGKNSAEIKMMSDSIVRMMHYEYISATAEAVGMFQEAGIPTNGMLDRLTVQEIVTRIVRRRIYEFMRKQGLPVDDFETTNTLLKRAQSWKESVKHGPGAIASMTMRMGREAARKAGLPFPSTVLANAIGTGINYQLFFTPFWWMSDLGKGHSPFFTTEMDRYQRAFMALLGTMLGGLVIYMISQRDQNGKQAVTIRKWPKNKQEAQEWAAQGRKSMTAEFNMDDGSFIPISLIVGPMAPLASYAFAGQAVHDLFAKQDARQKQMNDEAAKLGVVPGKVEPPTADEWMAVAGNAALGTLMGNRTFSGMTASMTQYGTPNLNRVIATQISPLIPGLPGYQELTRMAGIQMDSKSATVADLLVPLPSSQGRLVNILGDPVKTPDDVQRVLQVMTGGTFPLPVNPREQGSEAAYAALYGTSYRPSPINPAKGYNISGIYRPMTSDELEKYSVARGQYLKQGLAGLGGGATKEQVQQAYQEANSRALADVGVQSASKSGGTVASVDTAPRVGGQPRMTGFGGRSLRTGRGRTIRVARAGVRGFGGRSRFRTPRMGLRLPRGRSMRVATGRRRGLRTARLA